LISKNILSIFPPENPDKKTADRNGDACVQKDLVPVKPDGPMRSFVERAGLFGDNVVVAADVRDFIAGCEPNDKNDGQNLYNENDNLFFVHWSSSCDKSI
jgi:hypothetical protein